MKKNNSASKQKATTSIPKLEVDKNSSVRVRQIQNGFIVEENGTTGKGRNQTWYTKEYFSPTNPVAGVVSKGPGRFGKK